MIAVLKYTKSCQVKEIRLVIFCPKRQNEDQWKEGSFRLGNKKIFPIRRVEKAKRATSRKTVLPSHSMEVYK